MANQVININRKKYAVGLFWQPVGAGTVPRTYARNLARSVDKKLNLFTEYRAMVGLGASRLGHRSGMPAAAAEIMDSLTEYSSFLAVFPVGNVYLLVAARNGIILQDKIFDTADDARAEYFKLSEIPDWAALIAPSSWGMPRAIERSIDDMIKSGAHAVLHPISHFRGRFFSVVILALFIWGIMYFFRGPISQMISPRPQMGQIDPELAAEYKRQIEEKDKELDAQFNIEKPLPPEPIVMPYEHLPNVMDRANVCYQAIGFLMQPVSGWNQVSAECGETHASASLKRSFGTIGDFYKIATDIMPSAFVSEQNENNISVRAKLPAVDTESSVDERDADTVVRDIYTAFQNMDSDVQTNIVVDTLSNGVETATVNIVEISAESKLIPMQFMKIFDDFGGVYMTRCAWNAANRTWNYEVIIYAK